MVKEVFTTEFWCRAIQNHNTNTVPSEKPSWRQHKFGHIFIRSRPDASQHVRYAPIWKVYIHAMCQGKTTVVELLPREWHRNGPISHRHTQNTCHDWVWPLLQHTVCRTLNFVRSSHHACARVAQTQTTPCCKSTLLTDNLDILMNTTPKLHAPGFCKFVHLLIWVWEIQ